MSSMISSSIGGGADIPEGFDSAEVMFDSNDDAPEISDNGLDGIDTIVALDAEADKAVAEEDEDELLDPDLSEEEDEEDLDDEEEDEDEDEDEDPEPEPEPKSRAGKRIRDLVQKNKELEQNLLSMNQRMESQVNQVLLQQQQQYNAHFEEMQRQNAILQDQLRLVTQGSAEEKRLEEMSDLDRFMYQQRQETLKEFQPIIEQTVKPLQEKLAHYEQKEQQEQAQKEQAIRLRKIEADANSVLERDYSHVTDPMQKRFIREQLLTTAATYGKYPSQVSNIFANGMKAFGVERSRPGKKSTKSKHPAAKARNKLPRSARTKGGAKAAQQSKSDYPAWDKLLAAGYNDYHEWRDDGAPMLT